MELRNPKKALRRPQEPRTDKLTEISTRPSLVLWFFGSVLAADERAVQRAEDGPHDNIAREACGARFPSGLVRGVRGPPFDHHCELKLSLGANSRERRAQSPSLS